MYLKILNISILNFIPNRRKITGGGKIGIEWFSFPVLKP